MRDGSRSGSENFKTVAVVVFLGKEDVVIVIWDRERYLAHCNFEFTGKEMFCELFGLLIGLEDEWRRQGASEKEILLTAFDWDYVLKTNLACDCFAVSGIIPTILEDTAEATISRDAYGRTVKLCKQSATIPLPMEYPVKTMDDWMKNRDWYKFSEERIDYEKLGEQKLLREKGYLTILNVPGGDLMSHANFLAKKTYVLVVMRNQN